MAQQFANQTQQRAYYRIMSWLFELFPEATIQASLDQPEALVIVQAAAMVVVGVRAWAEDAVLHVASCVSVGTEATPDFKAYLVETNGTLLFGGLGLEDGNVLWYDRVRAADVSKEDVKTLVLSALAVVHHFTPEITSRFGGVSQAEYCRQLAQQGERAEAG